MTEINSPELAVNFTNGSHNLAVLICNALGIYNGENVFAGGVPITMIVKAAEGLEKSRPDHPLSEQKDKLAQLLLEIASVRSYAKGINEGELQAMVTSIEEAEKFVTRVCYRL